MRHVVVQGRAIDAKAGAAILIEDEVIHLDGLRAWENGITSKTVSAEGELKPFLFTDRNASGQLKGGLSGEIFHLLEPRNFVVTGDQ